MTDITIRQVEQLVYAKRGIVIHVAKSKEVIQLFALRPTTVAEFLTNPLSKVRQHRTRR